jgi:hypothetical protein
MDRPNLTNGFEQLLDQLQQLKSWAMGASPGTPSA